MRVILSIFTVLSVTSVILADPIPLDLDPDLTSSDSQWLRYNNGTPEWYTWAGVYQGVWFDVQDFFPDADSGYIEQVELWFYHAPRQWDTSQFYLEVFGGDKNAPDVLLDQTMMYALHYQPTVCYYDPPVNVGPDFWCVVNTAFCSGGWPSIMSDGDSTINHSFLYDGSAWMPYIPGEYMIAVCWEELMSLHHASWGKLKTVF